MLLALFLAACPGPSGPAGTLDTAADSGDGGTVDSGPVDGGGADGGGADGGGADTGGDTGPLPVEPVMVVETVGDQDPDIDSWFFDAYTVHEVSISLSSDSVANLDADPYTYTQGDATVDGTPMPSIGVRLRGKIGSFRYLSGKPKFKLDFNQYVSGQRFYGLETLSLNNSVVDCSYLKEPVAYRVMREAGVPASRTSWAHVTVNGADYGLYVVVETPDDRFLDRVFADPSGNLYDGKYIWYTDGSYNLLDFGTGDDDLFSLEEGTDVGNDDIRGISDAVLASYGSQLFDEVTGTAVDWGELHRELAAEQWVGHNDGYALNTNNYRVYFDPDEGGLAQIVPWDFDYGFLHAGDWGMSWESPRGTLAAGCWADVGCRAAQRAAVLALTDHIEGLDLLGYYDDLDTLTYDLAQADPRRECSMSYVDSYRTALRSWIETRDTTLRVEWGD